MTRLIYIANIRLPTEKAHGLQITQNCEAFAAAGVDVTLWTARRFNTPDMQQIDDVHAHYGVARTFDIRRLFTVDMLPLVPGRTDAVARLIFYLQLLTFTLSAAVTLLFTRADVVYSRDPLVLLAASLIKPRAALAYEAHQLSVGRAGKALQVAVMRRAGTVVAVTDRLRTDLLALVGGADAARVIVAHDGVRAARFEDLPAQADARAVLGWDKDAFVVGYVGRLHTMKQDKGVGTLIRALADVPGASVALVGGPDDMAAELKREWEALGLSPERFLYTGQVPPDAVPRCLSAFDVCVMPLPFTPHFAYHASPLKLFEYMASGRAVVMTDLPAWADVVRDGENALLVPPSDVPALAAALNRLRDNPALREGLGITARRDVMAHHTWGARADVILRTVRAAKTHG